MLAPLGPSEPYLLKLPSTSEKKSRPSHTIGIMTGAHKRCGRRHLAAAAFEITWQGVVEDVVALNQTATLKESKRKERAHFTPRREPNTFWHHAPAACHIEATRRPIIEASESKTLAGVLTEPHCATDMSTWK